MEKIEEFWYCVSNQDELPIYKAKEVIDSQSSDGLIEFLEQYKSKIDKDVDIYENDNQKIISQIILEKPSLICEIRKLIGISDKRLYLELSYIFNRYVINGTNIFDEKKAELKKHSTKFFINALSNNSRKLEIANIISNYFIDKKLVEVLDIFLYAPIESVNKLFKFLMEPKELQQKEAKYRGHGAEMYIAQSIKKCNQIIYPELKAENPMESRDPNVDLSSMKIVDRDSSNSSVHSFDIIIKDKNDNIRVLVQSLIHSSDPGQYGVDKSNETIAIKNLIDKYNLEHPDMPRVYLWGSVDGVGFIENPNGTIIKMINYFDMFVQINTTFKIGIELHKIGLFDDLKGVCLDEDYFDDEMIQHFKTILENAGLKFINKQDLKEYSCILCGKGILCI